MTSELLIIPDVGYKKDYRMQGQLDRRRRNGGAYVNGRIRKRSNNSWELTVERPRRPDGKRDRVFKSFKGTKAEAQRRLRELVTQVEGGLVVVT